MGGGACIELEQSAYCLGEERRLRFRLRWSRWELGLQSVCHLAALSAVLRSELLLWLEIAAGVAVGTSYLLYLLDRLRSFFVYSGGSWQRRSAELLIGTQSARLSYLGKSCYMQLPEVIYFSEFLLVLRFRPDAIPAATGAVHLALWPDSLVRREDRRLRRYLRFDLPAGL